MAGATRGRERKRERERKRGREERGGKGEREREGERLNDMTFSLREGHYTQLLSIVRR